MWIFLFWARSQSEINTVRKSFEEYGPSYNWEHSRGESVYDLLGIDIKIFDDGGLNFYETGLIQKVLEDTGMENCNEFPTTTKV